MKTQSKVFVLENETLWENVGNGIDRQILGYDGQLMLVKVRFKKGAIGSMHEHFHSQSTMVVSGIFEFTVGVLPVPVGKTVVDDPAFGTAVVPV